MKGEKGPSRLVEGLLVALGFAALLAAIAYFTPRVPLYAGYDFDGRFYAAMAGDPKLPSELARIAPWCFRVLTPWLVSYLPGSTVQGFYGLNGASWLGTALLVHYTARRMGAGAQSAALAVTLMLASFVGPRFSFYSPFYIEPLMIFLLSAGVALIARNRFAPLLCLIPVGMLQRPQVALLGVCSLVADWQARRLNVRRLLGYAATFAVAGFVNLGLERMIQPSNEYAGALPSMWGVASMLVLDPETAVRSLLEIGIAVGALAVAVAFLPEGRRFFVRHRWAAAYLIAIGGSLLGGADKGRLAFAAAPVLALALAIGLSGLSLGPRRFAALAAVLLAGHLVTQAPWTDLTSAPAYLDSLVPTSAPNFRPGAIGLRLLVGNTVAIVGILLAGARAGTPGD